MTNVAFRPRLSCFCWNMDFVHQGKNKKNCQICNITSTVFSNRSRGVTLSSRTFSIFGSRKVNTNIHSKMWSDVKNFLVFKNTRSETP
jgi:hypothetical protein